jgi:diaminohydroxyphosphoribosylaminopyrimidine deaminase/5-amino-6-(5-phosphoribosylamino)uracil reductase
VLVEGGGELNSCFIDEGLADKIVIFYAPKLIGGKSAPSLIDGKGIDFLKDACRIDITSVRRLKEDICVEGYVHRDS